MTQTTLTNQDFQTLHLLAQQTLAKAPHQGRFHNIAADFEDLFDAEIGHADQRDEYQSALSPTAYFVDLLRLVSEYINPPDQAADANLLALPKRRPDLFELMLTQENADTLVPYLEIVNQVMRRTLEVSLGAHPSALQALATSHYPMQLPFHLPLTQLQSYLQHFHLNLAQIYATFQPGRHDAAWAAAMLNITPDELTYLATPAASQAALSSAYNVKLNSQNPLGGLDNMQTFMAQTGVTADQYTLLSTQIFSLDEWMNTIDGVLTVGQWCTPDQLMRMSMPEKFDALLAALPTFTDHGDFLKQRPSMWIAVGAEVVLLSAAGIRTKDQLSSAAYGDLKNILIVEGCQGEYIYQVVQAGSAKFEKFKTYLAKVQRTTFDYQNRFMRLAQRLGWSFDELAWALASIKASLVKGPKENVADLIQVAQIQALKQTYSLTVDELCAFWADLRRQPPLTDPDAPSFFDQIFNTTPLYETGAAQGGDKNTIQLAANATTANDAYTGRQITLTAGTAAGQTRTIISYEGESRIATVDQPWQPIPDAASQSHYRITYSYLVGVAQKGTAKTLTLATMPQDAPSLNGLQIAIVAGTGAGQVRTIKSYAPNGPTLTIAADEAAWDPIPDSTSHYAIAAPGELPKIRASLQGALNLTSRDYDAIVTHLLTLEKGTLALDLALLTRLYRVSRMAQVLQYSITDYLTLLELLALPRPAGAPAADMPTLAAAEITSLADLLTVAQWANWLHEQKLTPAQLDFLVRGHLPQDARPGVAAALTPAAAATALTNYWRHVAEWAVTAETLAQAGVGPDVAESLFTTLVNVGVLDQIGMVKPNEIAVLTSMAFDAMLIQQKANSNVPSRIFFIPNGNELYKMSPIDGTYQTVALPAGETKATSVYGVGDRLFLTAAKGGYISDDNGQTWYQPQALKDAAVSCTYAFSNLVVMQGTQLFLSDDGGTSWTHVSSLVGINVDMQLFTISSRLFAYTGGVDSQWNLFYSDDRGISWVKIETLPPTDGSYEIYTTRDRFFALGDDLYYSDRNASSWTKPKGLPSGNELPSLTNLVSLDDHLFWQINTTIFVSTDNGETWKPADGWKYGPVVEATLLVIGSRLWARRDADQTQLYSDDKGETWQPATNWHGFFDGVWVFGDRLVIYDGTGEDGKHFAFSDDQGTTWTYWRSLPFKYSGFWTQFGATGNGFMVTPPLMLDHPQFTTYTYRKNVHGPDTALVIALLQNAATQQHAGTLAFWSEIFGAGTEIIETALVDLAYTDVGQTQHTIAATLAAASRVQTGIAHSGSADMLGLAQALDSAHANGANLAVTLLAGAGAGQSRTVTQYDAKTQTITVDTPWQTPPNGTSAYLLLDLAPVQQIAQRLTLARHFGPAAMAARRRLMHHSDGKSANATEAFVDLVLVQQIGAFKQLSDAFALNIDAPKLAAHLNAQSHDPTMLTTTALLRYLQGGDGAPSLALCSGWPADQITALTEHLTAMQQEANGAGGAVQVSPIDPQPITTLATMQHCFALAERLGTDIQLLIDLCNLHVIKGGVATADQAETGWQQYVRTAQAFLNVLRSQYSPAEWHQRFDPLRDRLNEQERDALAALTLAQLQGHFPDLATMQDLYEYLLIDVEMSGCAQTSVIKAAIDSLQVYIQRCRMNLEADVTLTQTLPDVLWDWMGHFRTWQANRRIFLYPENYLDPTLRAKGTSPEFITLKAELLQGAVSQEQVERAYINYFDAVTRLANLVSVAVCDGAVKGVASRFLFGKSHTEPPVYYYRYAPLDANKQVTSWQPWRKIELPIHADTISPIFAFNKLFIFWVEQIQVTEEGQPTKQSQGAQQNQTPAQSKTTKATIKYTFQQASGQWMQPQVLEKDISIPLPEKVVDSAAYPPNASLYWSFNNTLANLVNNNVNSGTFYADGKPTPPNFAFDKELGTYVLGLNGDKQYVDVGTTDINYELSTNGLAIEVWIKPNQIDKDYMRIIDFGNGQDVDNIILMVRDQSLVFQITSGKNILSVPSLDSARRHTSQKTKLEKSKWHHILINMEHTTPNGPSGDYTVTIYINKGDKFISRADDAMACEQNLTLKEPTTSKRTKCFIGQSNWSENPYFDGEIAGLSIWDRPISFSEVDSIVLRQSPITETERWNFELPHWKNVWLQLYNGYISILYGPKLNASKSNVFPKEFALSDTLVCSDAIQAQADPSFPPPLPANTSTLPALESILLTEGLLSSSGLLTEDAQKKIAFGGAYGLYCQELFLHIPFLIGRTLQAHQQFAAAKRWYETIFNPTDKGFWHYLPFQNHTLEKLKDVIANVNAHPTKLDETDLFDPFVVADGRLGAYEQALAMAYIDNLLAWGDALYAQDGWENINAATTLYVLAAELLGPRPEPSQRFTQRNGQLAAKAAAAGNDVHQPRPAVAALLKGAESDKAWNAKPFFDVPKFFFLPENDHFARYWDIVEQRLYQIRHCMNLQGVVRQLPLYQQPIDPRQLLRQAAAGRLTPYAAATTAGVPHYRFTYLLERTRQVVGELKQLGGALLSALEKQDAEHLAVVRATYEGQLLNLTTLLKEKQQEELAQSLAGLRQSLESARTRQTSYQGWATERLSSGEESGLSLTQSAGALRISGTAIKGISVATYLLPNIFGLADGGMDFGDSTKATAEVLDSIAAILEWGGQLALTRAQYDRRQEEWQLQAELAGYEIAQIESQIAALAVRQAMAAQELTIHKQSITQSTEIERFLRQKFTNQELYQWMVGRIGVLYQQTYQLALDLARQTERAFQFERNTDATYLNVNGWDSLHKGLLVGEALALNLNQLEKAYLEQNSRQLEIEKTISLRQLNPQAVLDLKQKGSCTFALSEALFDRDFPGHYLRKIKSISISIPAIVGPYQTVQATLIQQSNQIVVTPDLETVKFLLGEANSSQPDSSKLRANWRPNQQIALSRGVNDAGIFELNFRDERYLPFEGTGTVSTWELRMPKASNLIDFESISDVLITLRYTARDGGNAFRQALVQLPTLQALHGYRIVTARQLNAAGWQALKNGTTTSMTLAIDTALFPHNVSTIKPDAASGSNTAKPMSIHAWSAQGQQPLPAALTLTLPDAKTALNATNGTAFTPDATSTIVGTWTISLADAKSALAAIDDLLLIIPFQGTLNWG